jgi:8-oxo-dGTP pyrophosphatase MutT (NUDIX family)
VTRKHPTSSVFVFRRMPQGWRLGLIRHPRYGRMMIPGGHVEDEESPAEAALREVAEEAGLAVRLVSPPAAPLPGGYLERRVAQPWWIVEYQVPRDNHLDVPHVHIDHLYVALPGGGPAMGAAGSGPAEHGAAGPGPTQSEPEHPFGWYGAADLPGLHMFEDARILALALLSGLDGLPGPDGGDRDGGDTDGTGSAEFAAALLAHLGEP